MEPDDLSFLEISGEDDSLLPLQQIPIDDISSLNKTYFTCSPLQIPRSNRSVHPPPLTSPIAVTTGNKTEQNLNLSSHRDTFNRENTSMNKPEVPKLSMEPQKMKRKKKGGGYNLRKSLAWDRAFFTEEGVLDPLELSLISGNTGKSSGGMLSVIHEDRRESLAGDSEDLTALEENLFKEWPASAIKEDRKSDGKSLPKKSASAGVNHNVASTSAAKRKVLSAQDVNRSGSKRSGCPRPVASSTLKKPANVNTTKAATKELNASKIPIRKPDPSVHPSTVKITFQGVTNSKRNQITEPVRSVQRKSGLKSSSNSSKSACGNAKSGLEPSRSVAMKSSVQQARRNVASSALEIHSSSNSQHSLVTKVNDTSKINPGPSLPASGCSLNKHDDGSDKIAISLPPTVPCSGVSMQNSQLQTAKPSGLRLPSPSLGFFNQSKAVPSHSLLKRSNHACNVPNSNIPNMRKIGALNAIHGKPISSPRKIHDMVTGMTASAKMKIPCSITESSFPSNLNSDSLDKTKSNLHVNDVPKMELNLPSNSNSFSTVNNEQSCHSCNDSDRQSLKNMEQSKNEKISHAVDNELQSSDNKLLLRSAPSEQLMKDDANDSVANIYSMGIELSVPEFPAVQVQGVFEVGEMIDNQCEEEKMCNASIKDHSAFLQSQSGNVNGALSESQSADANGHGIKVTSNGYGDLLSCHDANEENRKQAETTMPCTLQVDQIYSKSQGPWTENSTLSRETSEFRKCISTKIEDSIPEVSCRSGGEFESFCSLSNSKNSEEEKDCGAGVDDFCTKSELQDVSGILSVGRGEVGLCSSALDNMVFDDVNENVIDANGYELKSSGALCSKQPAVQDSGLALTVVQPHGDDTLSGLIDTEFRCDINLHDQITSGIPEMTDIYQKADLVTASNIEVPSVCSNSGCELENFQCLTYRPSTVMQVMRGPEVNDTAAAMQVRGCSVINDINEHEEVEGKKWNLSVNNHHSDSDLQPGENDSYCPQNTSTMHNNQLNYMHVVNNLSIEVSHIPEKYDKPLFDECIPFEESRELNTADVADVSLDVKSCGGRRSESSLSPFQHKYVKQTNEEVPGVGDTIKKILVDNAQMQVLDVSLSVDSCNRNFNSSTVKNNSSVVVDDVHEQSREHPELYNSDLAASQVSLDAHGLCLNSKLIVNNCSSEEFQERNVCGSVEDVVLDETDACGNELSSVGTELSVKNLECHSDVKFRHDDDELSSHTSPLRFDVSLKTKEGQIAGTANTCNSKAFCSLNKESVFSVEPNQTLSSVENIEVDVLKSDVLPEGSQNNGSSTDQMQHELEDATCVTEDATMSLTRSVFQDLNVNAMTIDVLPEEASISQNNGSSIGEMQHESEDGMYPGEDATMSLTGSVFQDASVNAMNNEFLTEEAETVVSQKNGGPSNEMQHEMNDAMSAIEDKNGTNFLKESGNDKKQNNLVIKPPPRAVPFSDEWLAAFEAAGEEILTMKRGAVQNSPPDKNEPEPGPWSPVKRKNNQGIGPYDCTKFTNNNIPP